MSTAKSLTDLQIWYLSRAFETERSLFIEHSGAREYFGLRGVKEVAERGKFLRKEPFSHAQRTAVYEAWNDLIKRRLIKKVPRTTRSYQITKKGFDLLTDILESRPRNVSFSRYQSRVDEYIEAGRRSANGRKNDEDGLGWLRRTNQRRRAIRKASRERRTAQVIRNYLKSRSKKRFLRFSRKIELYRMRMKRPKDRLIQNEIERRKE